MGKTKLAALDPLKHLAKSQTAIQYNFSSLQVTTQNER
ncbi:hypothetical protein F441_20844 [Phytophthora nicotianae CJ01A1]|uniref:Uncharacterized protein n=4 Tax=Phytophthora nicotianae TaxID=4792 RepID=W2PGD5_PHYN3|nr:hypothetical protein PPTG_24312 [Phytophthora nicotianae INRA-310]ETN00098.1 hypothetical protein PPTG_24312 [Phytophthora nicotianae INRA-310]ETO60893.1 hypothetical protein F444_20980 [Phytophthora nicotianae P1976]ETP01980.1 hypothetical protein F441_20844 [Phytophthora nicotianae CJ01A1]ETP30141.1 hypothetical protein F442_20784 [Phytophthora nicotianae P10297]